MEIYDQIVAERKRQDAHWGGPEHDDNHEEADWEDFIREYAYGHSSRTVTQSFRERILKIAALAMAAIEWNDRECIALIDKPSQGRIYREASNLTVGVSADEKDCQKKIEATLQGPTRSFRHKMELVLAQAINIIYILDLRADK